MVCELYFMVILQEQNLPPLTEGVVLVTTLLPKKGYRAALNLEKAFVAF